MTYSDVKVPRRLQKLGDALEPIRELLHAGLFDSFPDLATRGASTDDIHRHLERITNFTHDVVDLLEDELLPLLDEKGTPADYKSLSKGLRRLVRSQLRHYHALEADDTPGLTSHWLAQAYRHNLNELLQWLEEFVDLTRLPTLSLGPDALPHVTLALEFTPAPELDELLRLANDGSTGRVGGGHSSFWETVGAVALGVVTADFLISDHDA